MNESINIVNLANPIFGNQLVQSFSMNIMAGCHANAQFTIQIEKSFALEKLKEEIAESPTGIVAADGTVLFNGILQNISFREQSGFAILNGKLLSGSSLLDAEIKSRSFQDVSMTYQNVIEKVLKDTSEAGAVFAAGEYEKVIEKPIIQYRETDWQFINRLASRCKSCIIPDITQPKPWIYFGVKKSSKNTDFGEEEYNQTASRHYYYMGADVAGWRKGDYYHVDVESTQNYEIGDATTFKEKALKICGKSANYLRNEVIFTYRLAKESYNQAKRYDNQKISGMTLLGTVLETAEETLKIHLDIDKEQDPGTAYPYHWVPPSGNLMYLMPKCGTRVSLYCPDSDEQNARAINCVRTNGGADGICKAMESFENRCLTTEHGKQMYFHPGSMGFVGGSGMLSQTDGIGTMLRSGRPISIQAKEQIKINAPEVKLKAKQELTAIQGEN